MNKILASALLFFFITSSFITVFNSVLTSSELVENSWNTKTAMTQARTGLGVVVDGKIYAIDGQTDDGYVGTNEMYDPKTDTCVTLEPMPTSRFNFGECSLKYTYRCVL
jgi:hypothetical protein